MNLFETLSQLKPITAASGSVPTYLMGAFRRKSISFYNGLTDENTIVYWFQSKSFTIDLRLKSAAATPIVERQAWVGYTHWDTQTASLSWELSSNYQNHTQWPEPATLHTIGNCILEFSPSNAYVEDWRQQASMGLFLGLRLVKAVHVSTQQEISLDGGLIICGEHMAYAQSRLPHIQQNVDALGVLSYVEQSPSDLNQIESYEVSVSTQDQLIQYSSCTQMTQQQLILDGFEVVDTKTLIQRKLIGGEAYQLVFVVDVYEPEYTFQNVTPTTADSRHWLKQEQHHLMHHATVVA